MVPHITLWNLFGCNQFEYTKKRSARDVLTLVTIRWAMALDNGNKYLFTAPTWRAHLTVCWERLLAKRIANCIHPKLVKLIGA